MKMNPVTPSTPADLRAAITARYDHLSKVLQQIARYALDEPNEMAIETLSVIAKRCGVQPSAIVRFAQSFGFEGASQMQRLFRTDLLSNHAALSYNERVRSFREAAGARGGSNADLLTEFIDGNILAVQSLSQAITPTDVSIAVKQIVDAQTVFTVGYRRSFPVAAYLAYSLQQTGKRTAFVSGVGGMSVSRCRRPQAMMW